MAGFSHSKNNIYYNFCLPKYTANHFQKPIRPYFYYWPRHLTLKIFVLFLCPSKSPRYFWHFIFQEDMIDAALGISTCSLVPLATLQLSPYTRWGTCGGEGKRGPFPWAWGEDAIPSSPVPRRHVLPHSPPLQPCITARCSAGPLRSHTYLVQATPMESHQWQPSPSGFLNLFLYA